MEIYNETTDNTGTETPTLNSCGLFDDLQLGKHVNDFILHVSNSFKILKTYSIAML